MDERQQELLSCEHFGAKGSFGSAVAYYVNLIIYRVTAGV